MKSWYVISIIAISGCCDESQQQVQVQFTKQEEKERKSEKTKEIRRSKGLN